jgi:hypothetical protein
VYCILANYLMAIKKNVALKSDSLGSNCEERLEPLEDRLSDAKRLFKASEKDEMVNSIKSSTKVEETVRTSAAFNISHTTFVNAISVKWFRR